MGEPSPEVPRHPKAGLLAIGAATGLVSGLLGIGGGVVAVFGLAVLLRWTQHSAHATALAAIPPLAAVGATVFAVSGNIDARVGLLLIAGAFVGAALGARIMARMPELLLRRAFGVLMLAVGIRLLLP
ncbi:MAG TPA: sulfite exporter TauE/SafE family protein [Actinomycetota bacterium]|nr:sulfite exporter TauE/SafE family protein [Actinomycetota bacterium]